MDWPKAKSFIIIALLVTDLVLGGALLGPMLKEDRAEREAADNIRMYLEEQGAELDCELPSYSRRLPVLFVSFGAQGSQPSISGLSVSGGALEYKGIPVVVEGGSSELPVVDSVGASKGDIRPSAYAAAELAGDLLAGSDGDLSGLRISDVYLVYWLYNNGSDASDTAFPYWCFDTDEYLYYVSAYYE